MIDDLKESIPPGPGIRSGGSGCSWPMKTPRSSSRPRCRSASAPGTPGAILSACRGSTRRGATQRWAWAAMSAMTTAAPSRDPA